jgi:cytochrome c553
MGARCLSAALSVSAALAAPALASPAQDYMLYCMGCHGTEAQGVPGKVPALAGNLSRFMRTPDGRNYVLRVPGAANSALPDDRLAAVLNWLSEHYPTPDSAAPAPFTVDEVARTRHVPLVSVQETRRAVLRGFAASGVAPPSDY